MARAPQNFGVVNNRIGVEGGKVVAAVLKETQITILKYAAFTPNSPPR